MAAIISIDTGSSSMKATLLSMREGARQGKELARSVQNCSMPGDDAVRVELDAAVFADALAACLADLVPEAARLSLEIRALALTSQRSSVLAVDENGRPLRPILMWHDKRSAPLCEEINRNAGTVYAVCGMKASPVFSASKMRWLKDNEPDIYRRAAKLLGIHDYLLFLLTGDFVTDASFASRTNLLDLRGMNWSPELIRRFGLDREKLCAIRPVGSIVGHAAGEAARRAGLPPHIPVISAGGDQQCAALGLSVLRRGDVAVNTGTGAFVTAALDGPVFDPEMRVLCNVSAVPSVSDLAPGLATGRWVLEAAVLSAGLTWQWFCGSFFDGDFHVAEAAAVASPPGAGGVIMLPCLGGKGSPDWNPGARASFHGMSLATGRGDLARACLEGIAAELADCLALVRSVAKLPPLAGVRCAGGLSQSPLFARIFCDSCGVSLHCFRGGEATTRGLWMSAALALGDMANLADAFAQATREEEIHTLTPDAALHDFYTGINRERHALYAATVHIRSGLRVEEA